MKRPLSDREGEKERVGNSKCILDKSVVSFATRLYFLRVARYYYSLEFNIKHSERPERINLCVMR